MPKHALNVEISFVCQFFSVALTMISLQPLEIYGVSMLSFRAHEAYCKVSTRYGQTLMFLGYFISYYGCHVTRRQGDMSVAPAVCASAASNRNSKERGIYSCPFQRCTLFAMICITRLHNDISPFDIFFHILTRYDLF